MSPPPAELLAEALPEAVVFAGNDVSDFQVTGLLPNAVVQPQTPEQVATVLRLADERGLVVAPRGGGTLLDLGNPLERLDVVLDLSRLDAVVDYQPDDLTLTVQAGITKAAVDRLLAERGQMLALDVPLPEAASIGGALAANVSGPRRLRYGTARDLVIGMQVALADGTLARSGGKVVKNVAGYDLAKLHIGGLGTCGVITEVTFKLWPAPPAQGALLATFDSFAAAHSTAVQLLNGQLFPAAIEIVDPNATVRLPVPADSPAPPQGWTLAVLLLGTAAAVERQALDVAVSCQALGAKSFDRLDRSGCDATFASLRDFGRASTDPAALILRAAVIPVQLPAAEEALRASARTLEAEPSILARPSAGLAFGIWGTHTATAIPAAVRAARSKLQDIGGTVTVERAPLPAAKLVDAWGIDGTDVGLMRRLKQTYDPNRVLNRGRFVAGI